MDEDWHHLIEKMAEIVLELTVNELTKPSDKKMETPMPVNKIKLNKYKANLKSHCKCPKIERQLLNELSHHEFIRILSTAMLST